MATGPLARAASTDPVASRPPGLAWSWSDALFGAVCAVPAAVVATTDVTRGIALAFGVLPAVIVGVAPRRRARPAVVVVGVLMGVSILVGSLLGEAGWLAVPAVFAMAVGSAELAQRRRVGRLVMTLALPLVAIGFSYAGELGTTAGLAVLLTLGSVYGAVVALAWPERAVTRAAPPAGPAPALLGYGLRLGAAGAVAAAVGFALDWDHVGWACGACLLVMRPAPDLVTSRGVGRLVSVLVGALAAVVVADHTSSGAVYAVAVVVVLVGASATHTSRWYVTSAFTTFLVISLLAGPDAVDTIGRFNERLGETALGVALALLLGTLLPLLSARRTAGAGGPARPTTP